MARNLCTSYCCHTHVTLADLVGKPIEFRAVGGDPPVLGTRWDCPECGTAYFAFWRNAEWSHHYNDWGPGYVIDLSYYESYNDEHRYDGEGNVTGLDSPWCVVTNDDKWQWAWGDPASFNEDD